MIKSEIHKLFKIKASVVILLLVMGVLIYSMAVYGEFGYNLSSLLTIYSNKGLIAYSEENGKLLTGQNGYEKNKEVATRYRGEVNDLFLEQLHLDMNHSSYVGSDDGEKFYNATYSFFQDVFNIGSDNYARRADVWGNVELPIIYGFTGDWDAYGNILNDFFFLFSFFIIVFAAPVFTYDRECNMNEYLGTVKNGGSYIYKHKAMAVFCIVNFLLFIILVIISIIHFSQYGFTNADVNIQCSFEQSFIEAKIHCTMGQLTIWRIAFGVIGCNTVFLLTMLISMLSQSTLTAFAISLTVIWMPCYPILQMVGNTHIQNLLLYVMPINAFYINVLLGKVPGWNTLWIIFAMRIVLIIILYFISIMIWKKNYLFLNRRGDGTWS